MVVEVEAEPFQQPHKVVVAEPEDTEQAQLLLLLEPSTQSLLVPAAAAVQVLFKEQMVVLRQHLVPLVLAVEAAAHGTELQEAVADLVVVAELDLQVAAEVELEPEGKATTVEPQLRMHPQEQPLEVAVVEQVVQVAMVVEALVEQAEQAQHLLLLD